jgi:hypothetical protein
MTVVLTGLLMCHTDGSAERAVPRWVPETAAAAAAAGTVQPLFEESWAAVRFSVGQYADRIAPRWVAQAGVIAARFDLPSGS